MKNEKWNLKAEKKKKKKNEKEKKKKKMLVAYVNVFVPFTFP